jgi:ABC-type phosphate transport system substrate-binding protein
MLHWKKYALAASLSLMGTSVVAPRLGVNLVGVHPAIAQTPEPSFTLPTSVPDGTKVKLDGSSSMNAVNQLYKQRFEQKFAGTGVDLASSNSDDAVKALIDDKLDIAALGRPLTDDEKGQGVKANVLAREKIAIIVGADNPFQGDITFAQFAKVFRGEIKNWSELGGPDAPIRFIDRPENSDTRRSLSQYPVFQEAPFVAGETAKSVADDTAAVTAELGKDGIGYAVASQAIKNAAVRIVPMHKTLPDDPRYPYSQPRNYAYKVKSDGSVSPAASAFMGYALSPEGEGIVQESDTNPPSIAVAAAPVAAVAAAATAPAAAPVPVVSSGSYTPESETGAQPWWWLVPAAIAAGGGLLWWLGRRGAGAASAPSAASIGREPVGVGAVPRAATGSTTLTPPPATNGAGLAGAAAAISAGAAVAGAAAVGGAAKRWRSVLTLAPQGATEAEAKWNWEEGHPDSLRREGGTKSVMRLYDVTAVDLEKQPPNSTRQFDVPAGNHNKMNLPIAQGDRDYMAELGYLTNDGRWIPGIRSNKIRMPGAGLKTAAGAAAVGAVVGAVAVGAAAKQASRISLKPVGKNTVYASWDIPDDRKAAMKQQGGEMLQLKLHDATMLDLDKQAPHSTQVFDCDERKGDKLIPIDRSDCDYVAELGYKTRDNGWLSLGRSKALQLSKNAGLAAGAAGVAGLTVTAAAFANKSVKPNVTTRTYPETNHIMLNRPTNTYVFDAEQTARLQQAAVQQVLQPGHYTLKIKEGRFGYRPLSDHPGEPLVMLWLKGGRLIGDRTEMETADTWLTLNGYGDEYKVQILEATTLYGFFVDTYRDDNNGEVTVQVTQDR